MYVTPVRTNFPLGVQESKVSCHCFSKDSQTEDVMRLCAEAAPYRWDFQYDTSSCTLLSVKSIAQQLTFETDITAESYYGTPLKRFYS